MNVSSQPLPGTQAFNLEPLESRLLLSTAPMPSLAVPHLEAEAAHLTSGAIRVELDSSPTVSSPAVSYDPAGAAGGAFEGMQPDGALGDSGSHLKTAGSPGSWTGNIPNGTIWASGVVEHVTGIATVPVGATLTIEPGAIVKFDSGAALIVNGTLQAQGLAASPIIFTSLKDDSVGGDTNGDGGSSHPAAGDWSQIDVNGTGAVANFSFVQVTYAGGGFSSAGAIEVDSGQATFSNVTISNVRFDGLRLSANNSIPFVLTDVSISNTGGNGLRVDSESAVESTGLTVQNVGATAVTVGDAGKWSGTGTSLSGTGIEAIKFGGGTIVDSRTWGDPVVYWVSSFITVQKGGALTLPSGAIVKFDSGTGLTSQGALNVSGTSAAPIILTSIKDDTAGGDTNADGAKTAPAAGDWGQIDLNDPAANGTFNNVQVRYAGGGFSSAGAMEVDAGQASFANVSITNVKLTGVRISYSTASQINLTDLTIQNAGGDGVRVDSSGTSATVDSTNLTINNVGGVAVNVADAGKWNSTGTTLSGTGIEAIKFGGGTIASNQSWNDSVTYYLGGLVTVAQGATLTIAPRTVVKADRNGQLTVNGSLVADGTALAPIIFTSLQDDSVAGDTNGDGTHTTPAAGDWSRIYVSGGKADLAYLQVNYAGRALDGSRDASVSIGSGGPLAISNTSVNNGYGEGIWVYDGTADLTGNAVNNVQSYGLRLESSKPVVATDNQITNAASGAMRISANTPLTAFNNTATGSGHANVVYVTGGSIQDNRQWQDAFTYDISANITINPGASLTIAAGLIVKVEPGVQIQVQGALTGLGTAAAPIVFTSLKDDSVGGDTNGDGAATHPAAGDWDRIWAHGGTVTLDHVQLLYGGRLSTGTGDSSLSVDNNGSLTLTNSLVQHGFAKGVWMASGSATVSGNTIDDMAEFGLRIDETTKHIDVTNNSITNAKLGVLQVQSNSDYDLTGSTWSNVGMAGAILVKSNNLDGTRTWRGGTTYFLTDNLVVNASANLTLGAGAILKFPKGDGLQVQGTLTASGTAGDPVIFTSAQDDAAGGDSNGDGSATKPSAGDWFSIWQRDGILNLNNAEIRYAGLEPIGSSYAGTPALLIDAGMLTASSLTVSNAFDTGFRTRGSANAAVNGLAILTAGADGLSFQGGTANVTNVVLDGITGWAQTVTPQANWQLSSVQVLHAGTKGTLVVGDGTVSSSWTLGQFGLVVFQGSSGLEINGGVNAALTILPGTILKLPKNYVIEGSAITAVGTSAAPILFTSVKDDTAGGDTNGDGSASSPAAGDWGYLGLDDSNSSVGYAQFRYGGQNASAGTNAGALMLNGASVNVNNVVIQNSAGNGISVLGSSNSVGIENALIYGFANDGIYRGFGSGTLRLINNTINGGKVGVRIEQSTSLLENNIISGASIAGVQVDSNSIDLTARYNDVFNPGATNGNYNNLQSAAFQPKDRTGEISSDPLFENPAAGQFDLGSHSPAIDAADATVAPYRDLLDRFRFDDPDVANTGAGYPNFVDLGALERQDSSNPALRPDLTFSGSVQINQVSGGSTTPLTSGAVQANQPLQATWTVSNAGVSPASGNWHDDVFLSKDSQWDINDVLIGSVPHSGPLGSGQSYQGQLTFAVPPAVEGNYYLLVRTNSGGDLKEADSTDNVAASASLSLTVPSLPTPGPIPAGVTPGEQTVLYKVVTSGSSSQDLRVTLASLGTQGPAEILVAKDRLPTESDNDVRAYAVSGDTLSAQLSLAQAGTYYVLAQVSNAASANSISIQGQLLSLSILSVSPNRVGNAGLATITIEGAQLTSESVVSLISSDGSKTIAAQDTLVNDSSHLSAQFDLTGAAPGAYTLDIKNAAGEAKLASAVTVIAGTVSDSDLVIQVFGPSAIRPNLPSAQPFVLQVTNNGPNDAVVPPIDFTLYSETGQSYALLRLSPDGPVRYEFHILLIGKSGLPGVVESGETIDVPVQYLGLDLTGTGIQPSQDPSFPTTIGSPVALQDAAVLQTRSAAGNQYATATRERMPPNAPIDNSNTLSQAPPGTQSKLNAKMGGQIGDPNNPSDPGTPPTYSQFIGQLLKQAERLVRLGSPDAMDGELVFADMYQQVIAVGLGTLTGQLLNADTNQPIPNMQISLLGMAPDGVGRVTTTDQKGMFEFDELPNDQYQFRVDGYQIKSPASVTVLRGQKVAAAVLAQLPAVQVVQQPSPRDAYQSPYMILVNGVPNLVFEFDGQIYYTIEQNGSWLDPVAIPDATGQEPVLVYSPNLVTDASGANVPGLAVFFRENATQSANGSVIMDALAKQRADGTWQFSHAAVYSPADTAAGNFGQSAVVDAAGQAIVVWQRQDLTNPDDQTRLYFSNQQLALTSVTFDQLAGLIVLTQPATTVDGITIPAGAVFGVTQDGQLILPADQPATGSTDATALAIGQAAGLDSGALAQACDPSWSVNFSKSFSLSKIGEVPSWVPAIGGLNIVEFKAGLEGTANLAGASASASVSGSVSVLDGKIKGTVQGQLSAKWLLDRVSCQYVFDSATLSASLSIAGKFPIPQLSYHVEVFGYTVGKFEIGVLASGSLTGSLTWTAANGLYPTGKIVGTVTLGVYGEAQAVGDTAKASITGSGSLTLTIDDTGFQGASATLNYSISAKFGPFQWSDKGSYPPAAKPSSISGTSLDDLLAQMGDQFQETSTLTLSQKTGTTTVYAGNTLLSSADFVRQDDGPATLVVGNDGLVYAFWTRESSNDAVTFGNTIQYATFNGTAWSDPVQVPNTLGFNHEVAVTKDVNGNLVLTYAHGDVSGLNSSSTVDQVLAAYNNTDVYYITFANGKFSAPNLLFNSSHAAANLAINRDADGGDWLTWTEGSGSSTILYASHWNGATWSASTQVAQGYILDKATEQVVDGLTTLIWEEASTPLDRNPNVVEQTVLYTARLGAGGWTPAHQLSFNLASPALASASNLGTTGGAALLGLSAALASPGGGSSGVNWTLPISPPQACCQNFPPPSAIPPFPQIKTPPGTPTGGGPTTGTGRPTGDSNSCTPVATAIDPNAKLGPGGYGDKGWVADAGSFGYTIDFENDPTKANAPALDVEITDQLPSQLDFSTFAFKQFTFGNQQVSVPAGSQTFSTSVNTTNLDGSPLRVVVTGTFNVATGQITVDFKSIDPATGETPLDPYAGFLPPDDASHRGEGSVSYTVAPKPNLPQGTLILNQASVVFDVNPPLLTPVASNAIDQQPPRIVNPIINGGSPSRSSLTSLGFQFQEEGLVVLTTGQLQVENLEKGANSTLTVTAFDYVATTGVGTLTLASNTLADGDYRVTLPAGSIKDAVGNVLNTPYTFTFSVLKGDVNGDRVVNDLDLYQVWSQLSKPAGARNPGDDLNGDGVVNAADLALLKSNYLAKLPTPAPTNFNPAPGLPNPNLAVLDSALKQGSQNFLLAQTSSYGAAHRLDPSRSVGEFQSLIDSPEFTKGWLGDWSSLDWQNSIGWTLNSRVHDPAESL
jgi:hypothetical protein